jgi:LPXTG-site transpeptidase (sortase) family protein
VGPAIRGGLAVAVPALLAGLAVALLTQPEPDPPPPRPVLADGQAAAKLAAARPVHRRAGARPAPPAFLRIRAAGITVRIQPIAARRGELEVPPVDRVGWFRRGPRPGEPGRTVLIGHRDSEAGAAPFAGLAGLSVGDRVETIARGSRDRYRVSRVEELPKSEFQASRVYATTDRSSLALITCEGVFEPASGYSDNLIVYARAVGRESSGKRRAGDRSA